MFEPPHRARQLSALVLLAYAWAIPTSAYAGSAYEEGLSAQFRGCDVRVCRFMIAAEDPSRAQRIDVHPRGVVTGDTPTRALAIRDRLNALLSNMIHQHKRIELFDMNGREDGSFDAMIVVNGENVAHDAILLRMETDHLVP